MNNLFSAKVITLALWISVVGICAVAEIVAILAFWNMPNDHLFMGLGTKYLIMFIVALPMLAGLNGYYSVRRRLSSASDDVIVVLSRQFLFAIIGPLAEALRPFLR